MTKPPSNVKAMATTHSPSSIHAAPEDGVVASARPDHEAGSELLVRTFNEVRDELVSTLLYVLGNREDALDIAQEVFLRCWRTQEGLSEVQNLRAWIFRVGLNAAKDLQRSAWKRRAKPLVGGDIMPQIDASPPWSDLEEKESLEQLRQALAHLRPEEKEVFLLRQNGEMTYEQIAEMSNRPVGTVKTQMRSALQKLRQVLVH